MLNFTLHKNIPIKRRWKMLTCLSLPWHCNFNKENNQNITMQLHHYLLIYIILLKAIIIFQIALYVCLRPPICCLITTYWELRFLIWFLIFVPEEEHPVGKSKFRRRFDFESTSIFRLINIIIKSYMTTNSGSHSGDIA